MTGNGKTTCPGSCGRTDTRLYACGWRCPAHTPARLAGRPEPDTARYCAPLRCYCGNCDSYDRPLEPVTVTVVDFRAVASGKRRAPLADYRAAQAQVRGNGGAA
jgi:hypothetical protein